jgi:hypothetical protein
MLNILALAIWVLEKKICLSFYYMHIGKINESLGRGQFFTPGLLFEQTW